MKSWPLFLAPFAAAGLFILLPIRPNTSGSEPIGLYWTIQKPPFAEICLPLAIEQRALSQGLILHRGDCPGGVEPLLKQLYIATPAHPVAFSGAGFLIDGHLLPNTAPLPASGTGKPLNHLPFAVYTTGVFAISTHASHSFDSRYFGPVTLEDVVGYAKPILVAD